MLIREAAQPRYRQVYSALRHQLEAQELAPHSRIPPDRELVTQFHASRLTVAKAVAQLVQEGYLVRRPGSGTYVTDLPLRRRRQSAGVQQVALLVPYAYDRFMSTLIKSISDTLYAQDCTLHFYDSDGHGEREAQYLRRLIEQTDVQGVIAFPISMIHNRDLYRETLESGRAIIFVDRYFPDLSADAVATDNLTGAYLAVRELITQGHQTIAHLYPEEARNTALIDRRLGYERALLEAGLPDDQALVRQAARVADPQQALRQDEPGTSCADILAEWLARPNPPTAIFCANDFVLQSCILTLRKLGRRVPADVALAGFCDIDDWLVHVEEPFVGVRQQTTEIGRQAVRLLMERLQPPLLELSSGHGSAALGPQTLLIRPHLWFHGPDSSHSALRLSETKIQED